MITCLILADSLNLDGEVITDLAWDIACQDLNLTADYDRLLWAPRGPANALLGIEISDALLTRIKDALAAVVAP